MTLFLAVCFKVIYLRSLSLSCYIGTNLSVKWDGIVSDSFSVANGVHQGDVLSPILFTYVYG